VLWKSASGTGTLQAITIKDEGKAMAARIRHIALSVKDIDATADFYEKAFGLKRSSKSEGATAYRIYMSDGEINLALLQYKSEVGSGLKNPSEFVGIHHFGFQCDDFEEQQKRIEAAGGKFFFDLGDPDDDDFERKFKDPNGIIFDLNWKGWTMTSGKVKAKASGPKTSRNLATKPSAKAKSKIKPKVAAASATSSRKAARRKAVAGKRNSK
jgi:catechol 2,3-dioxygenase-like lactoylglutathione lyase family enzyme